MISSVSFGKKIPVTQFQVQNTKTGEFENATMYELDCKDLKDFSYMNRCQGNFSFKEQIMNNMWRKRKGTPGFSDTNFYTTETDNGKVIGICETYKSNFYNDITYISSEKSKQYKYSGQAMLASIGKVTLKNSELQNLIVTTPLSSVVSYYEDVCGFEKAPIDDMRFIMNMNRNKIPDFINKVEERTGSNIVDLSA